MVGVQLYCVLVGARWILYCIDTRGYERCEAAGGTRPRARRIVIREFAALELDA